VHSAAIIESKREHRWDAKGAMVLLDDGDVIASQQHHDHSQQTAFGTDRVVNLGHRGLLHRS
jgi:hypothetical protein